MNTGHEKEINNRRDASSSPDYALTHSTHPSCQRLSKRDGMAAKRITAYRKPEYGDIT